MDVLSVVLRAPWKNGDCMRALLAITLFLVFGTQSPAALQKAVSHLDTFLSDLHTRGFFDGSVVVSQKGRVIFAKGFGFADLAKKLPFTPETPSDGASLAKTFTAALLIRMESEGLVDLDRPVQQLLPEFPYPQVTLRHLLSHTSGIPVADYDYFNNFIPSDQVRTTETLLRVLGEQKPPLASEPGKSFEYSSLAYDFAALAAARAGGKPYSGLLDERFFRSLGITSAFARPGRFSEFPGDRTHAYRRVDGRIEPNDVFDNEAFHGGSNLYISARDLDKWNRSFLEQTTMPRTQLTRALELARIGSAFSGLTLGSWYRSADGAAFWYSGHLQGFHSEVFRNLEAELSIVYVSNNTIEPWLQKGLIRLMAGILSGKVPGRPTAPVVDAVRPEERRALAGTWNVEDVGPLLIQETEGHLYVSRAGVRYRLMPEGPRFFYVPGLDYIMGFAGAAGRPSRIYISTNLVERWATRQGPP